MTLLDSMMEKCTMLDKVSVPDSVLGYTYRWQDGVAFNAVITKNSSTQALIAEKMGVTEVFTVVAQKGFGLGYHDVFRREKDKAIFRITSKQLDSEAPEKSTIKIGKVTAERWELPDD